MSQSYGNYYLPEPSHWPIVGSLGLFCTLLGAINWLHDQVLGPYLFGVGLLIIFIMMYGWFRVVVKENLAGLYSRHVDHSFRWGMVWFIFSEVCFFGAFFGALYYLRTYGVTWLDGTYPDSSAHLTHLMLWPDFKGLWPLINNPDNSQFMPPKDVMDTWGIPALNTLILLTSGATLTWAHWGLQKNSRWQLVVGLFLTVALGATFLGFQAYEYGSAYAHHGLTLNSGIYGTTFFMLTGFHGLHVTIGTIMLIVMLIRSIKGHFSTHNHFAFEATAWYWHFVDVVWLILFIFVYWL